MGAGSRGIGMRRALAAAGAALALGCGGGGGGSSTGGTTVTPPPPPPPAAAPPAMRSFSALPDTLNPGQGTTLHWDVEGAASLSLSPGGAVTGTQVAVNPGATTTYTLTATNALGSRTLRTTVQVRSQAASDTTPPTVAFTAPASGATISGDAAVALTASDDTALGRVELWAGGRLLRRLQPDAPIQGTVDTLQLPAGPLTLKARAIDAAGNEAWTQLPVVVAQPAPAHTGTLTPASTTAPAGRILTFEAKDIPNVSFSDGTYYELRWSVTGGSVVRGSSDDAAQLHRAEWTLPTVPGRYWLRGCNYNTPNQYLEAVVDVTADTTAPTVTFTDPGTATLQGVAVLAGTAADGARVARLQLRVDGAPWGTPATGDTAARLDLPVDTRLLANGAHDFSMAAEDASGNATVSAVRRLQVQNDPAPARDRAFDAPAVPQGTLAVKLYPTEGVAPGTSCLVTFGVPFPKGSLKPSDLGTLRVLRGGTEVPAHVELLAPWRHLTDPALDGRDVRVALVQLHAAFTVDNRGGGPVLASETLTLDWGHGPRTQDVGTLADPRTGWHAVTSGSFSAADGISEPDVYAVLPADWLCRGVLKPGRMLPLDASIPEARMDPAGVFGEDVHPGGFRPDDLHLHNWFFTLVNQDDPQVTAENQCAYRAVDEYEPWLYDRASAMFVDHFRSGHLAPLREAVRAAQFYAKHLKADGIFDLKTDDDPKYSYAESMAYCLWLTGDRSLGAAIRKVPLAFADVSARWSFRWNFWTERHVGFRLLAHAVAWEALGDAALKTTLLQDVASLEWHQDGAGGQLPADRVDGALWHTGAQHAGDADPEDFAASPWMTALVVDGMLRVYAQGQDPKAADFIRRVGTFQKAGTRHMANDLIQPSLSMPDYMTRHDGAFAAFEDGAGEHCPEVAAGLGWAAYFARQAGHRDLALEQAAAEHAYTWEENIRNWTRPAAPPFGLPAYRVSPWRKYAWQHRTSGSLAWLLMP